MLLLSRMVMAPGSIIPPPPLHFPAKTNRLQKMNSDKPKPRLFAVRECPAMAVCLAGCNTSEIQLQRNRSGKMLS